MRYNNKINEMFLEIQKNIHHIKSISKEGDVFTVIQFQCKTINIITNLFRSLSASLHQNLMDYYFCMDFCPFEDDQVPMGCILNQRAKMIITLYCLYLREKDLLHRHDELDKNTLLQKTSTTDKIIKSIFEPYPHMLMGVDDMNSLERWIFLSHLLADEESYHPKIQKLKCACKNITENYIEFK